MVPIISIVGEKGSGKTTLIERIIPELKRRGYSVATIKHCSCSDLEIDIEGKDTFRHRRAGSEIVVISAPNRLVIQREVGTELSIDELVGLYLEDVEIVLAEGYKSKDKPKIEILTQGEPSSSREGLVAIISERDIDVGLPHFRPEEIQGLVDLIEERFLKPRSEAQVVLIVNGREIRLNNFVSGLIKETILGMVSSLRGAERPRRILLKVSSDVS